jgi:hypothetical protein
MVFPTASTWVHAGSSRSVGVEGRGLFTPVLGHLFVKSWNNFDTSFLVQIYHAIPGDKDGIETSPGFGGSAALAAGYTLDSAPFLPESLGSFRFGVSLAPAYEQAAEQRRGDLRATIGEKLVWNLGASISWIPDDFWVGVLNISDQTLMGPARNTDLARSISLLFTRRWPR